MNWASRGVAFIVVWTMALYVAKYGHDWNKFVLFAVIFMTYAIYRECLLFGVKN